MEQHKILISLIKTFMAEISQDQHRQKAGVPKAKKASLKVDLTPMVDLGFLLISFFIFTTTLAKPTAMKLVMPDDSITSNPSQVPESKTLNLILGANNEAYTYNGRELNNIKNIGNSKTAIRTSLIEKKDELKNNFGTDSGMIVLIKPLPGSHYADVVNALDEMLICNVKIYVLMDASQEESATLKQQTLKQQY